MKSLELEVLDESLAILRLDPKAEITLSDFSLGFFSITRTADELSIVCTESAARSLPALQIQPNWRAIKVRGPLDFALTGILASIATPLAAAGISIFALSTFDTDYVLVKDDAVDEAERVLTAAGHRLAPARPSNLTRK